jgi:hypothetical protein
LEDGLILNGWKLATAENAEIAEENHVTTLKGQLARA